MKRWSRALYQPCWPLGMNGTRVTDCNEHRALSRAAAAEGAVLLKNNNKVLRLRKGRCFRQHRISLSSQRKQNLEG